MKGFLKPDLSAYLFSPRDVVIAMHARRAEGRRSRPTPNELARRAAAIGERHRERYGRRSYATAILRACNRAFPHPTLSAIPAKERTDERKAELKAWRKRYRWSPLQLRHTAATAIRAVYGLEAAQTVLGHARADTTEIYAERDLELATRVMREIG